MLAQDSQVHVAVLARDLNAAQTATAAMIADYGARAHAVQCDVTDDASVVAASERVGEIGGTSLLVLINNAGVAIDLPWVETPWPPTAAKQTLAVNFYGAVRLTEAFLPMLKEADDGRVIFVSSGAGRTNLRKMSLENRKLLSSEFLSRDDLNLIVQDFELDYEQAATAASRGSGAPQLPFMSATGLWLQSYGFSKAALGAYCLILSRQVCERKSHTRESLT